MVKSNLLIKSSILLITLLVYFAIFSYTSSDKNIRIDSILKQQIENLKIHYDLTTKYFKITSNATVEFLENDEDIIGILTKFLTASEIQRADYRKKLEHLLKDHYARIQKQGVLQFHFLLPNNVTSFRMHKPSKFGDDLTNFKYSFRQVNSTKKPLSGLEKGRTSPSFRNVSPLYGKNGEHIGIVDVGFAPEIIQKNLYESNKIYSNFIIKSDIFKQRKWNRNDIKNDYKVSIENDKYFKYSQRKHDEDSSLKNIIKPLKKEIAKKMSKNIDFALYTDKKIVAFLSLVNMQNEPIAYLVSYTNSDDISNIINDFYILNLITIISLILIAFFIYKTILHHQELKDEKNRFRYLSHYDVLTKLPNRSLFYERLSNSISKSSRDNLKFALLFIDLDNFKQINDSYGHNEGDKVLNIVSTKLTKIIRYEDTLARLGGDEFVLIIEQIKNEDDVLHVINKIDELFKQPIMINSRKYYIGASIGITIFPDDSTNADELLKFSDVAMYKAKGDANHSFQFYKSSMTQNVMNKIILETELREAIKSGEFVVYYQPQINGVDNFLIGMEALVRWNHPTQGLITPFKFIDLAQESGLIVKLDRVVMREAMTQLSKWYNNGFNPGVLAINLSVLQIQESDFIEFLKNIIVETNCKPEWLELEVTEGEIMQDPEAAITILEEISKLGIELAIDDFGTGYSSLSYLKRLPINKLKIDQSFVKDLPNNEEDIGISKAVIALSQSLHLRVIAEGVETIEQKEFLIKNGCENIQGYFYSKPIPADKFQEKYFNL